jgi:hypothetical protein
MLLNARTAFRLGDENAAPMVREAVKRLLIAAA